ncbi:MAG TPA: hypothetical protein VMC41_04400 [Candidatus Nanoarchaeia archaeon]|nr:hypothetical protein [Candidatus Nanoarchaeia archaeon]
MAKSSTITLSGIFTDLGKDIIFFPFWWYSIGLAKTVKNLAGFVADKEKSLALFIWIKNIFVPMYGQRDIQGAIISFFIRLVQIIFRGIILLFWIIVALAAFWIWFLAPILIIYMIVWQII